MKVGAVVVRLPNLDDCAAYWTAAGIEHPALYPHDLAHAGRDGVVDEQQIVIQIERQPVGVVRSDGQRRSGDNLLGERALRQPQGGPNGGRVCSATEKSPARIVNAHTPLDARQLALDDQDFVRLPLRT